MFLFLATPSQESMSWISQSFVMDKGEAIAALKQRMCRVTPLPDEPNFATSEETLVRFLKANDWRYKDAEKALLSTVEYRRLTRPLTLDCHYCHSRPGFHSMRQVGFDESGRPVMYSSFSQASVHKNTVEDLVTHLTYLTENAKGTMSAGVTTWVFVIDCTWMTMGACNPKLGYNVTNILSSHYPERLGLVICVNISPVFHGVWKAIKKLLSPGTVPKVILVHSESKIRHIFSTFFSDELSSWLLEEIAQNKLKPLPRGQLEFWNPPSGESEHDPRGTASYVQGYVRTFRWEEAHVLPGNPKKHCPHPNIIDALGARVTAVSLSASEEAEREEALEEMGHDDDGESGDDLEDEEELANVGTDVLQKIQDLSCNHPLPFKQKRVTLKHNTVEYRLALPDTSNEDWVGEAVYLLQEAPCTSSDATRGFSDENPGIKEPDVDEDFLHTIFESVDTDKCGLLNCDELKDALAKGPWTSLDLKTVRVIKDMVQKDGLSLTSFKTFILIWNLVSDFLWIFTNFDKDRTGTLNKKELKAVVSYYGFNLSDSIHETVMRKFEGKTNGNVGFPKFIQCIIKLQKLGAAFKELDGNLDGYIFLHYEKFLELILG